MEYNGDTEEDMRANAAFWECVTKEELAFKEKAMDAQLAADYFKWGWEAAKEYFTKGDHAKKGSINEATIDELLDF